ncbi:hypothetical protein PG990_012004 [Apiospora arundinis]
MAPFKLSKLFRINKNVSDRTEQPIIDSPNVSLGVISSGATEPGQYDDPEAYRSLESVDDPTDSDHSSLLPFKNLWTDQPAWVKDSTGIERCIQPVLIDTGSPFAFITEGAANELDLEVKPTLQKMQVLGDIEVEATAFVDAIVRLPEIGTGEMKITALIDPRIDGPALIIGRHDIEQHDLFKKIMKNQRRFRKQTPSKLMRTPTRSFVGVIIGDRSKKQKESDEKKQKANSELGAQLRKSRKNGTSSTSTPPSTIFDQGSQTPSSSTAATTASQYSKHGSK